MVRWEGRADPLTLPTPPADTAALSHARLRSNSTGARHSTPRALDAGRGRRLGGPRDSAPEKSRTSPSGGRVPKSASVSALSLIITAGNTHGPALSLLVCPHLFSPQGGGCFGQWELEGIPPRDVGAAVSD